MQLSTYLSHSLALSADPSRHFPVLFYGRFSGDNFGYFLQTAPREVIAVDVPEGRLMLKLLDHKGWTLKSLLLTHTHHDHVVFLEEVLDQTGCDFYHPEGAQLPVRGIPLQDGERGEVSGLQFRVIDTSGHSPLDFSYWFPDLDLCFCGDTLFASGCGRMFAGPPERFWNSLQRLRDLPDSTRLCCGHDYFEDNRRFVLQTFPDLPELFPQSREREMPLLLSEQKKHNPFLRADDPEIASALGMDAADPAAVFKKARELRNQL